MKKLLVVLLFGAVYFSSAYSQNINAADSATVYVKFNTAFKPYVEGGYFITENIALTGGLGFYRDGGADRTFFLLQGGLDKFFRSSGAITFFSGGFFRYQANPYLVNGGRYSGLVTVNGHLGGWLRLTRQIFLDGSLGLNLEFADDGTGSGNNVNFTFFTSSVGIVFAF